MIIEVSGVTDDVVAVSNSVRGAGSAQDSVRVSAIPEGVPVGSAAPASDTREPDVRRVRSTARRGSASAIRTYARGNSGIGMQQTDDSPVPK